MLLRSVLFVLGIVELLAPRQFVDFWMAVAATDDSDVELRPWVYTAARIEGLLVLLWVVRRTRESPS